MTKFENKFTVSQAPKTFQVAELKEQQIKKSSLSPAARSKVINRSGSNYLSEKQGYGPCTHGCSKCSITAILITTNGKSKSQTLDRPVLLGEGGLLPWYNAIQTSEWGYWASEYGMFEENSFMPSPRARRELVEQIERIKDQCGHKTVAVTDKREWR